MPAHLTRFGLSLAIVTSALPACRVAPAQSTSRAAPHQGTAAVRVVLSQRLPPLDGQHLQATVVEVAYGPGGSSAPHTHPCAVIGYVTQGALRSQVKGEPEAVYRAGQSFYEAPNGVHVVSANASAKDSVRFLAYFTCDRETPLSVPVADTQAARGR